MIVTNNTTDQSGVIFFFDVYLENYSYTYECMCCVTFWRSFEKSYYDGVLGRELSFKLYM